MKNILKKLNFKTILLIIYIIVTLIITLKHEPWRDEAQAWLIAKNLNLLDIIKQMKYEGHPCLWHFILYPMAHLNLEYQVINILSWALGCISATILIKKSSFPNYINAIILLSYPFLYIYTAFARSYSLILLFISILISIFPKRKEKPIFYGIMLALLANTHILIAGLVGSLILIDFYDLFKEKDNFKRRLLGFSIEIIGVLLLFLQLVSSLSTNAETKVSSPEARVSFINSIFGVLKMMIGENYFIFLILFIGLIGIFIAFRKQKQVLFITTLSLIFLFLVNDLIYPFGLQHAGVIILVILFSVMIAKQELVNNRLLEIAVLLFFVATVPYSLTLVINDIKYNYSNAKDIGIYINNNLDDGTNILCTNDAKTSAIIPYVNDTYHFFYSNTEKEFTYISWSNERHHINSSDDMKRIINEKDISYIIYSVEHGTYAIKNLENVGLIEKIAAFDEKTIISQEEYQLYKVIKE